MSQAVFARKMITLVSLITLILKTEYKIGGAYIHNLWWVISHSNTPKTRIWAFTGQTDSKREREVSPEADLEIACSTLKISIILPKVWKKF